jgi:hypothetical protein
MHLGNAETADNAQICPAGEKRWGNPPPLNEFVHEIASRG